MRVVRRAVTCFFCAKASKAVCKFCGRAVCEDHTQFGPFVITATRSEVRDRTEALVVEDAVRCGVCKPRPQPVALPELD